MATITEANGFLYRIESYYQRPVAEPVQEYIRDSKWINLPSDSKVTSSNPSYKIRIAKKLDASSGYSRQTIGFAAGTLSATSSRLFSGTLGGRDEKRVFSWGFHTLVPACIRVTGTPDDATLRDIALGKLKNKLASNVTQFKALIPLGEIGELRGTVAKIADLSKEVVEQVRRIRKGRYLNPARIEKKVKDAWLTYSFGVKPLLGDAQSLAESIAEYQNRASKTLVLRGSASKTWVTSTGQTLLPLLSDATMSVTGQVVHELRYTYVAGVDIVVASSNFHQAASHFGFNLSDVPSALWELTAFSWIVDYFTTAGAFFEDAFQGSPRTIYCNLSTKYTVKATGVMLPVPSNSSVRITSVSPGISTWDYTHFSRTQIGTLPSRNLRFKTVDEIGRNAVNRLLNLASLGPGLTENTPRRRPGR